MEKLKNIQRMLKVDLMKFLKRKTSSKIKNQNIVFFIRSYKKYYILFYSDKTKTEDLMSYGHVFSLFANHTSMHAIPYIKRGRSWTTKFFWVRLFFIKLKAIHVILNIQILNVQIYSVNYIYYIFLYDRV